MNDIENISLAERIARFTGGIILVLGSLQYDVGPTWLAPLQLLAAYACISAMTGYDVVKGLMQDYRHSI